MYAEQGLYSCIAALSFCAGRVEVTSLPTAPSQLNKCCVPFADSSCELRICVLDSRRKSGCIRLLYGLSMHSLCISCLNDEVGFVREVLREARACGMPVALLPVCCF